MRFSRQFNCWSLRCSWSIACRRCSNYIFLLHLTVGFNILRKDNFKPKREPVKFLDLVHLILEILRYIYIYNICLLMGRHENMSPSISNSNIASWVGAWVWIHPWPLNLRDTFCHPLSFVFLCVKMFHDMTKYCWLFQDKNDILMIQKFSFKIKMVSGLSYLYNRNSYTI